MEKGVIGRRPAAFIRRSARFTSWRGRELQGLGTKLSQSIIAEAEFTATKVDALGVKPCRFHSPSQQGPDENR